MEIKVSNTTNTQLDWLVAKCEGPRVNAYGNEIQEFLQYSRDWSQGGPIIEREMIDTTYLSVSGLWYAVADATEDKYEQYGSTPLIAAMRCFVSSKLGDEVEVPDELCK